MKKRSILIVVLAVVVVVALAANIAAGIFAPSLDTYLGRGERVVTNNGNADGWDLDYYDRTCMTALGEDGSLMAAARVSKKITDEGIILMKNSDGVLPLAENTKVVPFGYRYADPVYGGTGSGAVDSSKDYVTTAVEGLSAYFEVNKAVSDKLLGKNVKPLALSPDGIGQAASKEDGTGFDGADTTIFEFGTEVYDGLLTDTADSVAVVYIGRISGEGGNLLNIAYADGTPHSLALTAAEKDMIALAKSSCKKVVAVINSSNIMELGPIMAGEYECDAIVWIGGPGSTGFASLADILAGKVNPSGRTVDVWDANILQNPTVINFGDRAYAGTESISLWPGQQGVYYYEYEEGVYYGYRYYETADEMDPDFVYGELNADGGLKTPGAVNYPFGYGMSYTTFEQKITGFKDSGDEVEVTVEVANTGAVDGKEVVQLYYTAPYTDFDKELHIEKPVKNLIAFDKVEVKAGGKATVTLSFDKEEMASYSYLHDNGDGTKGCYVLEQGDYVITLGKNSHEAWETKTAKIGSTVFYTNANPRKSEIEAQSKLDENGEPLPFPAAADLDKDAQFIAATNRFEDISAYMESDEATILTRSDWKNTQPTAPTGEKTLSPERQARMASFDYTTDPVLGDVEGSKVYAAEAPVSGKSNGLKMVDMRGLDYYDPAWEDFLDQIDFNNTNTFDMFLKGGFSTLELAELGKPVTEDHDGPQGLALTGEGGGLDACAYCSEVVVASTYNTELAYEYGTAIGEEALNIGVNGWYGPAANLHRSPLNGRNFEYYSEDPVLTGKIAAKVVSGAEQKGLVVYLKHFGWHTYEGVCTSLTAWCTEQAYRETDLKAFEIAVKEARKTIKYIADENGTVARKTVRGISGLMGAATHLGTEWQAANYELITNVVRGEWGFQGLFSTDMGLEAQPGNVDKVLRAGGDLRMHYMPAKTSFIGTVTCMDESSDTMKACMRRAIKNVCFAYANSNAVQGAAPGAAVSYKTSPWLIGLVAADVVIAAGVAYGVFCILRSGRKKETPAA